MCSVENLYLGEITYNNQTIKQGLQIRIIQLFSNLKFLYWEWTTSKKIKK